MFVLLSQVTVSANTTMPRLLIPKKAGWKADCPFCPSAPSGCSGSMRQREANLAPYRPQSALRSYWGPSQRVQEGPRLVDRYGRLLRYVYTESGQSIDEALIREGLAVAWTRDGQHRDHLVGLDREARAEGAGCLW